jgi:PhnB protein
MKSGLLRMLRECHNREIMPESRGEAKMADLPVNPAEYGMHGVCPHLVCKGAPDAMDWYKTAFNATEMVRLPGPDGRLMHGSLLINKCMVMIADEYRDIGREHGNAAPPTLGGTPVIIHMTVDDCDAWAARALAAGATLIVPIADMFWGDRYGMIEDPFGHRWALATPKGSPVHGDALVAAMNSAM